MNIKTLVIFLNMVSEQDGGIWTNDFQNMDTQNGKCFQYCLDAKLIETYTDSSDNTGYPEEYADLSLLGTSILEMHRKAQKATERAQEIRDNEQLILSLQEAITILRGKRQARKLNPSATELDFCTGKPVPSNPLLPNNLFATPESFQALEEYCLRHNGSERSAALACSNMAINLCHKAVDEMLSS